MKNYLRKYLESNNMTDRKLAQKLHNNMFNTYNNFNYNDKENIEDWQKYKSRDLFKHLKQEGDIKQV